MHLNLRKVSDFANCSIEHDNATIDLGFIDNTEAKQLLEEFQEVVWVGEIVAASELLKKRAPWRVADSIIEEADEFLVEEIGWDDQVIELTGK